MKKEFNVLKLLSVIFLGTGFLTLCAGMTFYLIDLLRGKRNDEDEELEEWY